MLGKYELDYIPIHLVYLLNLWQYLECLSNVKKVEPQGDSYPKPSWESKCLEQSIQFTGTELNQ